MNIPCDRPLIPPTVFSEYQVPRVSLTLPPQLQEAVPRTTALLLNGAQEKATINVARMTALNTLVANNFQNSSLTEWVDVALRIAVLTAVSHNAPQNYLAYLPEAVDKALYYLTSLCLTSNPHLSNSVNFETRAAANQNMAEFNNIRQNLFNVNLQYYAGVQQPYQSNVSAPMNSPMLNNYSHQYASAHTGNESGMPRSQWGSLATGQTQAEVPQPYQQNQQNSWNNNPLDQRSMGTNVASGNDWALPTATPTAFAPAPQQQPPVQQAPVVEHKPTQTFECATARGENEMDINNHALPYFGSNITVDMSNRRDDLKLEVLQVSREGRRAENSNDPILLDREVTTDTSFDSALFTARMAMANNLHNGYQNKLFRKFLIELNPVPCTEAGKTAMEIFNTVNGLEQLPGAFRSFMKAFTDPTNPKEDEQLALNFYTYLDHRLAKTVNDFMFFNLRLSEPRITSFSEDLEPLMGFLRSQRGENYVLAFQAWMSRFFDHLRSNINQENESFLSDYFSEKTPPIFGYFPLMHCVTLTNLTAKELDYHADRTGSLIDPKVTGTLAEIASGIHRNKKDLGIFSNCDWLITADDFRYRIAEDALTAGRYYIFRV